MSATKFCCTFCHYETHNFSCFYLPHIWDKHSLQPNFSVQCGISNCQMKYTSLVSFKRHIKSRHEWFYKQNFKQRNASTAGDDSADFDECHEGDSDFIAEAMSLDEDDTSFDYENVNSINHDDMISDFLLELREVYHVTQTAVSFLCQKFQKILEIDRKYHVEAVTASLKSNNQNFVMDHESSAILHCKSQFVQSFEMFSGAKTLSNYVKAKKHYIEPEEICIGYNNSTKKFDHVYYVPILKTLELLLSKEDVKHLVDSYIPRHTNDQIISTFEDGSNFKENTLFSNKTHVLQIIFYNDDFQCSNPLGNKTAKYKVSAFYFSLGNLSTKFRSRLKDIHLVALTPAFVVKNYGYRSVLDRFIADMKTLEKQGIEVKVRGITEMYLGTLSMTLADNLAAHALGCYYENFSTVQRFCRFCDMTLSKFKEKQFLKFSLRTRKGYDEQVKLVEEDPSLICFYGVKENSCLNELCYYHVVRGLPPDPAHDLFEGFCVVFMSELVVHYVRNKNFNLDQLNSEILNFEYADIDKSNKPQCVKVKPLTQFKVKLTACEMWNFLRLFPLLMGKYVDNTDPHWELLGSFLTLIERICAPSFNEEELFVLMETIIDFFERYCEFFPDTLKAKCHYIFHYPAMIRKFGPLIKTLRFEAKNGFCKSIFASSKNYKNICKNIATRHQLYMYLCYMNDNYTDTHSVKAIHSSETPVSFLNVEEQNLLRNVLPQGTEIVSKSKGLEFEGQRYYSGSVVILKFSDEDDYVFGKIEFVVYPMNTPMLFCKYLNVLYYDSHYHAYTVEESQDITLISILDLADYHPLGAYTVDKKTYVPLRYFVPKRKK